MTALSCMLEPSGVSPRLTYAAPARTSGFYVSLGTVAGARRVRRIVARSRGRPPNRPSAAVDARTGPPRVGSFDLVLDDVDQRCLRSISRGWSVSSARPVAERRAEGGRQSPATPSLMMCLRWPRRPAASRGHTGDHTSTHPESFCEHHSDLLAAGVGKDEGSDPVVLSYSPPHTEQALAKYPSGAVALSKRYRGYASVTKLRGVPERATSDGDLAVWRRHTTGPLVERLIPASWKKDDAISHLHRPARSLLAVHGDAVSLPPRGRSLHGEVTDDFVLGLHDLLADWFDGLALSVPVAMDSQQREHRQVRSLQPGDACVA